MFECFCHGNVLLAKCCCVGVFKDAIGFVGGVREIEGLDFQGLSGSGGL